MGFKIIEFKDTIDAGSYPSILTELDEVKANRYLFKAVAERPPFYLNGSSTWTGQLINTPTWKLFRYLDLLTQTPTK